MIKEATKKMLKLSDLDWGHYAFSRDPLGKKVTHEEKMQMIQESTECGKEQAKKLVTTYGQLTLKEYLNKFNINLSYQDSDGMNNYVVFAKFNYPNEITVYSGNVAKTKKLIEDNELESLLEHIDIESVLLSHELFHYLEEKEQDIYTKDKKIELWKLGPIRYDSKLVALSEIAAMSFTKELLQLSYNPYLFDGLMLYPHNEANAQKIIDEILQFQFSL